MSKVFKRRLSGGSSGGGDTFQHQQQQQHLEQQLAEPQQSSPKKLCVFKSCAAKEFDYDDEQLIEECSAAEVEEEYHVDMLPVKGEQESPCKVASDRRTQ